MPPAGGRARLGLEGLGGKWLCVVAVVYVLEALGPLVSNGSSSSLSGREGASPSTLLAILLFGGGGAMGHAGPPSAPFRSGVVALALPVALALAVRQCRRCGCCVPVAGGAGGAAHAAPAAAPAGGRGVGNSRIGVSPTGLVDAPRSLLVLIDRVLGGRIVASRSWLAVCSGGSSACPAGLRWRGGPLVVAAAAISRLASAGLVPR